MSARPTHKDRLRWEAAPRPADHALLVRDPGPMVIRNDKGRRALRQRGEGLCPASAAGPPHY